MTKKQNRDITRSLRFTAQEVARLNKATAAYNAKHGLNLSPSAYAVLCINTIVGRMLAQ